MKCYAILVTLVMMVAGCARPPLPSQPEKPSPALQLTMQQARDNFEAVKRLPVSEIYAQDFQEAQAKLNTAENDVRALRYDHAYVAATESLAASQRIFRQFYRDTITASARDAKARIEAITAEDPDNPLQEFLPQLTAVLDYAEGIDKERQRIEFAKVLTDFEEITVIRQNTQKTMQHTLESDVSFALGHYELSEAGRQMLGIFCQNILARQQELAKLYPQRTVRIKIKVVGYTDQLDFREGAALTKKLREGGDDALPQQQPARRQFLNRRLSEFRAQTVSADLVQCIAPENPKTPVEQENIGLGEDLPRDIPAPYPLADPRRRICKIYSYVMAY